MIQKKCTSIYLLNILNITEHINKNCNTTVKTTLPWKHAFHALNFTVSPNTLLMIQEAELNRHTPNAPI